MKRMEKLFLWQKCVKDQDFEHFNVEFSKSAAKFLEKIDKDIAIRCYKSIEGLQLDSFPQSVKRVENQWFEKEKVFRIRIGDYRILYCVNYEKKRVMIVNIDKRSKVYS